MVRSLRIAVVLLSRSEQLLSALGDGWGACSATSPTNIRFALPLQQPYGTPIGRLFAFRVDASFANVPSSRSRRVDLHDAQA
ncbi:hypothetical protein E4L95_17825 [Paracoccus liaowanqingii]|uniref:Uncharacterized protein n=1 Tax=Paracoccus liaowanqingii TaxID=2560053 RepID=A0A4P7HP17_9RHOB|nr:hypothetical protein [Paracoccus liaowanqingii]QBX35127.1 hypothetical protein E4191_10735 [Paracoccus liaowanqingii]TGN49935.1 hypothetical protein E4L95_17825 [Paracoccus liaowanqingii]